jgi:hypothetical protein
MLLGSYATQLYDLSSGGVGKNLTPKTYSGLLSRNVLKKRLVFSLSEFVYNSSQLALVINHPE